MNALAARRRHPAAIAILLFLGLALVGTAYSLLAPKPAQAAVATAADAELGKQLFLANCATCHGVNAEGTKSGPTLMGAVSYTHLRAHETVLDLVCRLLLENKNN